MSLPRISICYQIAQHIYNGETEEYTGSGAKNKQLTVRPEFLIFALITKENHEKLLFVQLILSVFALVMLAVLILFSFRFGRMASPGFVIVFSGLPGAAFFYTVKLILQNQSLFPKPAANEGASAVMGYIVSITLPPVLDKIITVYYSIIGVGFVILLAALIAKIVSRIFPHPEKEKTDNTV